LLCQSIETTGRRPDISSCVIFLERKMLELLFTNAIKHPGKLLALCFVAHLATISFVVLGLLILLAIGWLRQKVKAAARAQAEADAEARRAEAAKAKIVVPEPIAKVEAVNVAPATNDASTAPAAQTPQYARSAVVIPFRSGTR
jgi:flagellar biosynthesis component FlhA